MVTARVSVDEEYKHKVLIAALTEAASLLKVWRYSYDHLHGVQLADMCDRTDGLLNILKDMK